MPPKKFSIDFGGKELTIAVGQLASQANGAVVVTYGGTTVLVTCVMSKNQKDTDYMPLSVEYEERFYAAGRIKQGRYMKREGRPSDGAVLTGRMIDRCIRPLFDHRLRNEIQVIATVLSFDKENDPDIPALIGASTSLLVSDIPWQGPVAGVRVGQVENQTTINPNYDQRIKADYDIVVTGTKEHINMLEGGADQKSEEDVLKAIELGHNEIKKIIDFQEKIAKEIGLKKISLDLKDPDETLVKLVKGFLKNKLEKATYEPDKTKMKENLAQLKEDLLAEILVSVNPEEAINVKKQIEFLLEKETDDLVHQKILTENKRPDGRKLDQVRSIFCETGFLPRTHGTGLFQRGDTQALSVVTLGPPGDELTLESMEQEETRRFFHHYNFPPFSVGETGRVGNPGRREIGHGSLAERALIPLIPDKESFPYTIRVVSEILSSNGSSSMASVSGSSLALMDAGVPIKTSVSGIAMGLISDDQGNYKILTDIQGPEDHYGDMDCKIAGTKQGVTALQMDVKIKGVTLEILRKTFEQAKLARLGILKTMDQAIDQPRPELSPFAPRIITLKINPKKIGTVIGPGGKMINAITEETGVQIDIDDDGQIYISSLNQDSAQKALAWIKDITKEVKEGEVIQAKVVKITDFGAFAEILPGQDGLIHISEMADSRVEKVEDVLKLGDVVLVKVIKIDPSGKISLSLKEAKNNN